MMKILITGAAGQLGGEIVRMLSSGASELGELPSVYSGAQVTAVDVDQADITDGAAVSRLMQTVKPDVIFNCAAMTAVDACQSDPETAMRVNAVGPRNLAMAAAGAGACLVHVSTDYVFSGDASVPYREWDVCCPRTVYGKSKLLGERYVEQFCDRYFIVRTAWLYGLTGKNFVKTMRRLGAEKSSVRVVNDQRGNPTNAEDLAYHLLLLAAGRDYGIYHCTGKGECSWYEFCAPYNGAFRLRLYGRALFYRGIRRGCAQARLFVPGQPYAQGHGRRQNARLGRSSAQLYTQTRSGRAMRLLRVYK